MVGLLLGYLLMFWLYYLPLDARWILGYMIDLGRAIGCVFVGWIVPGYQLLGSIGLFLVSDRLAFDLGFFPYFKC